MMRLYGSVLLMDRSMGGGGPGWVAMDKNSTSGGGTTLRAFRMRQWVLTLRREWSFCHPFNMLPAPTMVLLAYIGLALWLASLLVRTLFSPLPHSALRPPGIHRHRRHGTKAMEVHMSGTGQQERAPVCNIMPHLQDLNSSPFAQMTSGLCMGTSMDGAVRLPPRRIFQPLPEDIHTGGQRNGPAPYWRPALDGGASIPPHLQLLPDDMSVQGQCTKVQYSSSILTGTTVPYVAGGVPSLEDVEDNTTVGQSRTRIAPSRSQRHLSAD
ncbi:hypothetical protein CBR_g32045 [Chara braunii]|uniref:Uncharacterized protein n=1 Tax=Chara braunii TaxID=69332 RepID=A0A388LGF5_CHABU|nr:hypothetical protein CBR_g32045 [Chara braunii]|eukprot:GBG81371.1 hypothetical protein CBR_g32045 [Chara braunii]